MLGGALSFGITSCSSAEAAAGADPSHQIAVQAEFDNNKSGNSELEGALFNTNNDVKFDDVILRVDFYNQGGSIIGSRSFVVKEKVYPGQSAPFKLKFKAPKDTESVKWAVVGADAK